MTMTNAEIFDIWAPPGGRWSPWAKPVLFACMEREPPQPVPVGPPLDTSWAPPASENAALVLDLPGAAGVFAGLALAARGFRPVPLYNAVPAPSRSPALGPAGVPMALVNVHEIMAALWHGAAELLEAAPPDDAPPVFLLDANRRGEGQFEIPGRFDNRSISFTTDFPSASFLEAHGVRRVVLAQVSAGRPQTDLTHTLRRWQEGGIEIDLKAVGAEGPITPLDVPRPSSFGALWQRVLALMGLRRHGLGGFGGFIPEPSSG
jgi:hypothetical protein